VVEVAAAKRKKNKNQKTSEWSWRLAGLALCAFFALGVITGLSRSGRSLAARVEALLRMLPRVSHSALLPPVTTSTAPRDGAGPVALVRRADGFYILSSDATLRGPTAPTAAPDLPILDGPAIAAATDDQLLAFTSSLVRAEADLGLRISELHADAPELAVYDLEQPAVTLTVDLKNQKPELERAGRILALWRTHADLLAAIDLTIPDQAIVRLRNPLQTAATRKPAGEILAARTRTPISPEVTARP